MKYELLMKYPEDSSCVNEYALLCEHMSKFYIRHGNIREAEAWLISAAGYKLQQMEKNPKTPDTLGDRLLYVLIWLYST